MAPGFMRMGPGMLALILELIVVATLGVLDVDAQVQLGDFTIPFIGVGCGNGGPCISCPGRDCKVMDEDDVANSGTAPLCADGSEAKDCVVNPCDFAHCRAHRNAHCIPNLCLCVGEWYDSGGQPIDCNAAVLPQQETAQSDICSLSKESGPCEAHLLRYFFNSLTRRCEEFSYGGCSGNENNFETLDQCEKACGDPSANFQKKEKHGKHHRRHKHFVQTNNVPQISSICGQEGEICGLGLSRCCEDLVCCQNLGPLGFSTESGSCISGPCP